MTMSSGTSPRSIHWVLSSSKALWTKESSCFILTVTTFWTFCAAAWESAGYGERFSASNRAMTLQSRRIPLAMFFQFRFSKKAITRDDTALPSLW